MDSNIEQNEEKEELNKHESNVHLNNIKSKYILKKILNVLQKIKICEIIRYNKKLQNIFNLNINDYKEFSQKFSPIKIEIKPSKHKYGNFINLEYDEKYYHIYFNDEKVEIGRNYLIKGDKVSKINIIIDYQVKSLERLFYQCECVESISFKKFFRNNITDMKSMFSGCSLLKELNISNINTENVTDMSFMFNSCSSLKKLNLSNFNTLKVTNMERMFYECSSLKELNLSNFNTCNVFNMYAMFSYCSSLKELYIGHFVTNKVKNKKYMFNGCSNEIKNRLQFQ